METGDTPDAQLEQQPTAEAPGPVETGAPPGTLDMAPAAEANEFAENGYPGDEFAGADVPTCANRRYPLPNRKPSHCEHEDLRRPTPRLTLRHAPRLRTKELQGRSAVPRSSSVEPVNG